MTMCKTIPTFILLLTGYCVKNMHVTASESTTETTAPTLAPSVVTQASLQPTTGSYLPDSDSGRYNSAAESNASLLVAGLSIFFVLFFICVIIGIWNARKLSKQDSFDITAAPSGEA